MIIRKWKRWACWNTGFNGKMRRCRKGKMSIQKDNLRSAKRPPLWLQNLQELPDQKAAIQSNEKSA